MDEAMRFYRAFRWDVGPDRARLPGGFQRTWTLAERTG